MSLEIAPIDRPRAHPMLTVQDLEALVHVHGRRLRNFIRRRVANAADVEDLMQDTYLEALRCLGRYEGASRPETWLFGIALNLVRTHYKRAAHRPLLEDEITHDDRELDTAPSPLETVERLQTIHHLERAVARLPVESMSVLTLVLDEHMTYEQVAVRLQIPVGTVRSRLSRARALLKGVEQRVGGL
ncbi:RNA polymerase sigma factor [Roseateles sp. SL47]|uniref:RNA polymerase sigma factor n=1 Tax=Roseateles sp. SL47 TaxID=2995138 RepID=UPI00226D7833|nr:RNA polymerase sigma factor [Roseateles sp. SL47]WAC74573.1 RNA polymerase sigma factor [Roseateles sp. SL47]